MGSPTQPAEKTTWSISPPCLWTSSRQWLAHEILQNVCWANGSSSFFGWSRHHKTNNNFSVVHRTKAEACCYTEVRTVWILKKYMCTVINTMLCFFKFVFINVFCIYLKFTNEIFNKCSYNKFIIRIVYYLTIWSVIF